MSCKEKKADVIIAIGTLLWREPTSVIAPLEASLAKGVKLIHLFSMEDPIFSPKSHFFSRYEVGSEEGVLALLAKALLDKKELPQELQSYFDELDDGYLSAESNMGEEEIEEIQALCEENHNITLWLGEDIFKHPRAQNCLRLAHIIASYGNIDVCGVDFSEETKKMPQEVASLKSYDGTVVYECVAQDKDEATMLIGSAQFAVAAKVAHHDMITVMINQKPYNRLFVQDSRLKGTIALMPVSNATEAYVYHVAKIAKVTQ